MTKSEITAADILGHTSTEPSAPRFDWAPRLVVGGLPHMDPVRRSRHRNQGRRDRGRRALRIAPWADRSVTHLEYTIVVGDRRDPHVQAVIEQIPATGLVVVVDAERASLRRPRCPLLLLLVRFSARTLDLVATTQGIPLLGPKAARPAPRQGRDAVSDAETADEVARVAVTDPARDLAMVRSVSASSRRASRIRRSVIHCCTMRAVRRPTTVVRCPVVRPTASATSRSEIGSWYRVSTRSKTAASSDSTPSSPGTSRWRRPRRTSNSVRWARRRPNHRAGRAARSHPVRPQQHICHTSRCRQDTATDRRSLVIWVRHAEPGYNGTGKSSADEPPSDPRLHPRVRVVGDASTRGTIDGSSKPNGSQ
jgi:hypothetical protein